MTAVLKARKRESVTWLHVLVQRARTQRSSLPEPAGVRKSEEPTKEQPPAETTFSSEAFLCSDPTNASQRRTMYEAGDEMLRPPEPLPAWQIVKDIFFREDNPQATDWLHTLARRRSCGRQRRCPAISPVLRERTRGLFTLLVVCVGVLDECVLEAKDEEQGVQCRFILGASSIQSAWSGWRRWASHREQEGKFSPLSHRAEKRSGCLKRTRRVDGQCRKPNLDVGLEAGIAGELVVGLRSETHERTNSKSAQTPSLKMLRVVDARSCCEATSRNPSSLACERDIMRRNLRSSTSLNVWLGTATFRTTEAFGANNEDNSVDLRAGTIPPRKWKNLASTVMTFLSELGTRGKESTSKSEVYLHVESFKKSSKIVGLGLAQQFHQRKRLPLTVLNLISTVGNSASGREFRGTEASSSWDCGQATFRQTTYQQQNHGERQTNPCRIWHRRALPINHHNSCVRDAVVEWRELDNISA